MLSLLQREEHLQPESGDSGGAANAHHLDLCPWQVFLGVAFAASQWVSTLWNGGFPDLDLFR